MTEHWFLKQSRKEADDIVRNSKMSILIKRELLNLVAARIEGFSLNLGAQPELFRECCKCRDEMNKLRDGVRA